MRTNEEPDCVNIEVWGKIAEVVAEHKRTGDQVAITGRLTSSAWTDDEGHKRSRLYVTAETDDFLHNAKTDQTKEGA